MTPQEIRYRQPGDRRRVLAITAVLLLLEVCTGLFVGLEVMR